MLDPNVAALHLKDNRGILEPSILEEDNSRSAPRYEHDVLIRTMATRGQAEWHGT
jgi:hypothetical protein